MIEGIPDKTGFLQADVGKPLLFCTLVLGIVYYLVMLLWFERGNTDLFILLMVGQTFHLWQLIMYIYTSWDTSHHKKLKQQKNFSEPVDIFITVAGEPLEIIEETVLAAQAMDYPNFKVYILNDGRVAKKDNWLEVKILAEMLGVECITREIPGGAKAGNINNALRQTAGAFVAIFDADHVPHRDFLSRIMPHFADKKVGFIQTPQFYKNQNLNLVTKCSWDQQAIFFGPICKGKNRHNAAAMCGTNMVIRRTALEQVRGMYEKSIAEDFITGMMIHEKGWKSIYLPEVLAEGLAPEDLLSYYKQQFRWARGALDLFVRRNFLFSRGLDWRQKLHYLCSVSHFLSGFIIVAYALIPLVYFYYGETPFRGSTVTLALLFMPYIILTLHMIQRSTNFSFTYGSVAFSLASFPIHLKAMWALLTLKKATFVVTPKRQQTGNFLPLVMPHLIYIGLVVLGVIYAFSREGLTAAVASNFAWSSIYIVVFWEHIRAALPEPKTVSVSIPRLRSPSARPATVTGKLRANRF